ncbi:MAG: putative Ig domain-containing protein, partial [Deltaproteobacteria bacterium]|nr:putative Ig domain-containing protein [Deltaproteobacteria bacterium]
QTFTNNGEEIRDILFDGNVCYDFHQGLMASNVENTDTGRFTFTNNVFAHGGAWGICVHDVSFITLWNNTFYDIQYHGAGFRGASTGNVVRNNIFAQVSTSYWGDEGGEVTGDFNLIFEAGDPGSPGANDLLGVDPLFVAPGSDDLRIGPDSPAIDAGDELTEVTTDLAGVTRPQGAGWDIGAWEYMETPPLTVVTVSLPAGVLDEPYAAQLQAMGGTPPYDWALEGGALPAGLILEPASGALSGTPTEAGFFDFTAVVGDADSGTASRALSITVPGQPGTHPTGEWPYEDSGCGCRQVGKGTDSRLTPLAPLLLLPLLLRRRRRRSPRRG